MLVYMFLFTVVFALVLAYLWQDGGDDFRR